MGYGWGVMARHGSRNALFAPEALDAILSRAGESRFARVHPPVPMTVWRKAVGARIAEHARPVCFQSGALVLRVATSVWAHELSFLAEDVLARLRTFGVEARALRFRVGPLPSVERPPERRVSRSVPRAAAIPDELAQTLLRVEDPSLRAAIERAAGSNLAWQFSVRPPPDAPVSEALRAARAPRSSAGETSPPDRASPGARAGAPHKRAGERDRSR